MDEKKAHKHLMRINEALYRVTDLLPDQEPVKWMARKKAMEALTLFAEDSPALFLAARMKKREEFVAAVYQLLDLLEFASHNTFISQINFDVLSREYRSFLQEAAASQQAAAPSMEIDLTGSLLTPSERSQRTSGERVEGLVLPEQNNVISPPVSTQQGEQKKENIVPPAQMADRAGPQKEGELSTEERRKHIFSYIIHKEKGITMQELLEIFKGSVNQRTLQRDIAALIERGRVKTSGARRWRRYGVV